MEKEFWINAWNTGRTAFHQGKFHEKLTEFFPSLKPQKGQRVLVPLCGKSVDMLWLQNQGLSVHGVELHEHTEFACTAVVTLHEGMSLRLAAGQSDATALDVTDATKAATTITNVDAALGNVNASRAGIGAGQNRLESVVNNLTSNATNLSDARSRIEDADYSSETTAMAKAQILSQASTAMIAQANQSQQNVLSLLR